MTSFRLSDFVTRVSPFRPSDADSEDFAEPLKRNLPLIPNDTIAGRALVTVIAIMTFLAAVAAGAGVLVNDASRGWIEQVSREMTIQVKPRTGRDIEGDVAAAADLARKTAGIANVRIFSKRDSERLLEPWLGTGLDLVELPIPRLIVFERDPSRSVDVEKFKFDLVGKAPSASLDDHGLWMERLAAMARSLVIMVGVIFLLVLVAMGLAVAFATRGAMAGNSEIVNVLHFVGARDAYIANEFQRHFLRLGLRGGAIGGGAAIVMFAGSAFLSSWRPRTPSGDQVEALFGTFAMGAIGYVLIALIALGIAGLTGWVSRSIVFRHLQGLN
jgi:cell division transport system permease protein